MFSTQGSGANINEKKTNKQKVKGPKRGKEEKREREREREGGRGKKLKLLRESVGDETAQSARFGALLVRLKRSPGGAGGAGIWGGVRGRRVKGMPYWCCDGFKTSSRL